MNIVANSIQIIDDEKQTTFFTLTNDSAENFRYHALTPILSGAGLQAHLDENIDLYYCYILLKKWPGADPRRMAGGTELERMEAWIADGHRRVTGYDDGVALYEVIEEVPFKHTHSGTQSAPEYVDRGKISDATRDELANASTIAALRAVMSKILLGA